MVKLVAKGQLTRALPSETGEKRITVDDGPWQKWGCACSVGVGVPGDGLSPAGERLLRWYQRVQPLCPAL